MLICGGSGVRLNPQLGPNDFIFIEGIVEQLVQLRKQLPCKFELPFNKSWIRPSVVVHFISNIDHVEQCLQAHHVKICFELLQFHFIFIRLNMDLQTAIVLGVILPVSIATVVDLTHTYGQDVLYPPAGPNGTSDMFNFTIIHRGYEPSLDAWYVNG